MSLYLGSTLISGSTIDTKENAHSLLDYKWTDHKLNEMSWLRANTFSWQNGLVYKAAYDHLSNDYNNSGAAQTETIGSYTITYYEAEDGHKIVLANQETTVTNIYNESGVAWYFILDTTNQRFKLPRINPTREELIQSMGIKGTGMAFGLTDGTNTGGLGVDANGIAKAYSGQDSTVIGTSPSGTLIKSVILGVTTDGTKSGIITDFSNTTSVFKGKKYLYFYVGEYSVAAIEQTAGINTETLNAKADISYVNSYNSVPQNITVLADGNYTTVGTSTVFTLSESFTNFEEIVTIGSFSGSSKTRGTAYRISTYWLNHLLTEMNSVDIWGSCAGDYAAIGGYNNSSKPSTTTSFAIVSSTYAQIGKIYGVNRKSS